MSLYLASCRRLLVMAGVFSFAVLSGCAAGYGGGGGYGGYGAYDGRDRGDSRAARQEAQRQAYERDLERRVTAALEADPRTKIYSLAVTSQGDGVVMISGTPAQGIIGRDLALRVAARVPGVRSVANNMVLN